MRFFVTATVLSAFALVAGPASRIDAAAPVRGATREAAPPVRHFAAGSLPCEFEQNVGQTADEVDYVVRCRGYVAFLSRGDAVIRTPREALRLHVVGGREAPAAPRLARAGRSHYFAGDDAARHVAGAAHAGEVAYDDVVPGVGLVYRTAGRELAFDVHVAPGTDPEALRLCVEGASWVGAGEGGGLSIGLPSGGSARLSAPVAWQGDGALRRSVTVAFAEGAARDEFAFAVGSYDATKPLVIDPGLSVSTYLGGSDAEQTTAIRTDAAGAIYLTGSANSLDFPVTAGAFQTARGEITTATADVFVTKLDATGQSVVWSTFLGGSSSDTGLDLAVDALGGVFVGGSTSSANFPKQNAYQTAAANGFVAKLAPTGASLDWSTYYTFIAHKLGLDASGNVRCYQTSSSRVFAFDATGQTLLLSVAINAFSPPNFTFRAFAVLPAGDVWLAGSLTNNQSNLSIPGAFQTSYAGGGDGWLVKVNTSGNEVYRSYLGGTGDDQIRAISVDAAGNLFVTGTTTSANFPVANPAQISKGSGTNAFVMKMNPAASALVFSTYLGGASAVTPSSITTNPAGEVFVAGSVTGAGFPVFDAYQPDFGGGSGDAFLAEYDSAGVLGRSTFLGGTANDFASAVAVSALGRPLVTGVTQSSAFPIACGLQTSLRGTQDAFLAGIVASPPMSLDAGAEFLPAGTVGRAYSRQLALTGGTAPFTWALASGALPPGLELSAAGLVSGTPASTANASMFLRIRDAAGQCTVREFRLLVNPAPEVAASTLGPWTVDRPFTVQLPRTGGSAPFAWELVSGAPPAGLAVTAAGSLTGTPAATGTFAFDVKVTDANGADATATMSLTIHAAPAVTTASLADWTEGREYHRSFAAIEGTPPFAWSIAEGSLPAGATLDAATGAFDTNGLVAGDSSFTVRATDAAGALADRAFTLHVNPRPAITSGELPFAAQNRPYAVAVQTTGGTPPFHWSVVTGEFALGFTGIDAGSGVVGGTPNELGTAIATVELVDAAGASARRTLSIIVVPQLDLSAGKGVAQFAITPIASGDDVMRYVELLAGSTLDVTAKISRANLFAIDVLVLDASEQPLDLGTHKKSKDPLVTIRKFPVPRTGRYLVVVRQLEGFSGNVSLTVSAHAAARYEDGDAVAAAGTRAVPFSAPPGSKVTIAVAAAGRGKPVPAIVSLKDAEGTELLVAGDLKATKRGAALKPSAPLDGGDYVVTFAGGATAGDIAWKISVTPPKGYGFTLPALPVSGH